jgi:hypothetical protein
MSGIIIDRLLYALVRTQRLKVVYHKLGVEGIGMIEVHFMAQVYRHVAEVAIVGVLLKIDNGFAADRLYDLTGDSSLSRPGSAAYAYYHGFGACLDFY